MNALSSKPWTDDEPLECVMVIPEVPNVKTFAFRSPSGRSFNFSAGQFVTLELPTPGGVTTRTYTISSSPTSNAYISVSVKAQPDSQGGRWMFDHLKPGMRLKARGPGGMFHLPQPAKGKYLFISGGSGITPMMSMTSFLFESGEEVDISFVSCARTSTELIFRSRLEYMASRLQGLKLHFVAEQDEPFQVWTGYRGRFNQLMLGLMTPDYLDRNVYCCGPEGFMHAVRDMLHSLGYDMSRYRQESFGAPSIKAEDVISPASDVRPSVQAAARVSFAVSNKHIDGAETDTLLSLAKKARLNIPSGCNMGLCGTCKVKVQSGKTHMVHNGGISEEDIVEGYVLACCSHPMGDVVIEM